MNIIGSGDFNGTFSGSPIVGARHTFALFATMFGKFDKFSGKIDNLVNTGTPEARREVMKILDIAPGPNAKADVKKLMTELHPDRFAKTGDERLVRVANGVLRTLLDLYKNL